ncbi:MAG: restriction endonuclease subunit S [Imperialibacter sp.]|uniref:restriction endonuclease subunit S n=1 Tax=Imperialibacter sp. TaxID=2038411 RepID=UPI0032EB8AB1
MNLEDVSFISPENFKKYFKAESKALTKPLPGDILLGIIGAGLGVPYRVEEGIGEFGISSSLAIIRVANPQLLPNYLAYWMKGQFFQQSLKRIQSGSAQGFLSLEMIRSLPIHYPSYAQQKKIASILSAYDDLIENNNQRIKLLEEMAEEIYREWFVRLRFPGYKDVNFIDPQGKIVPHSTLGALPEGWEIKQLNLLCKNLSSKRRPISSINRANMHGKFPYYGAAKIIDYIDDYIFEGKYLLVAEDGSVITSEGYPVLQFVNDKFWVSNHAHVLQGQGDFSTEYLYLSLSRYAISGHVTGAAQPKINRENLNRISLLKPLPQILTEFNGLIVPLFDQRHLLIQKNQLLQQTRDLLLPRLMSGKLDIENLPHQIDEEPLSMVAEEEAIYHAKRK